VARVAVGDIVEFDVTPAVGGNGVYSFAIVTDRSNGVEYRSREDSTNPPVLIITINEEGVPYYCDDDFDGYMDSTSDGTYTANGCIPVGCQTVPGNDCDDTNGSIKPGAVEVCDGIDNDCDDLIDDDDPEIIDQSTWYADADSDTYGDANNSALACNQPDGYLSDNTDCNDSDSAINPGAVEICDGIDNDCDTAIDEGFDVDGDTYTTCGGDCDDNDALAHPDQIWYEDSDGDGYSSANILVQCERPIDYKAESELTAISVDCNDSDSAMNPGADEVCDGIDNDCDAGTGDGSGEGWFGGSCDGPDADLCEEGMYECINGMQSCSDITGDIGEICSDGMDNDCDGTVDESNASGGTVVTVYPVADTTVDSNDPSGNYGSSTKLGVDGSPIKITYLRFDVTGIDRAVQSARLRLAVRGASSSGGTIHTISDNSWDENTVTFDTRPVVDGAALDTMGAVAVGDTIEFDITGTINENGIYSYAINSEISDGASYYSREKSAYQPELIITINEEGALYYCDDDFDGYMDSTSDGTYTANGCIPAGCQTIPGDDCDDTNGAINPEAVEICDGIDNDCNGFIDDAGSGC
jgi:hypothetical protein